MIATLIWVTFRQSLGTTALNRQTSAKHFPWIISEDGDKSLPRLMDQ